MLFTACCISTLASVSPGGKAPIRFSREYVQLINKYLPNFKIYETSTTEHVRIASEHWDRVFKVGESYRSVKSRNSKQSKASQKSQKSQQSTINSNHSNNSTGSKAEKNENSSCGTPIGLLYDAFYDHLEHNTPDLMNVFRSSMHIRSKVLVHISMGMRAMLMAPEFSQKLLPIMRTHMKFRVRLEFFDPLGVALLNAIQIASGPDWSEEIGDAWRRIYTHCAVLLLVEQKRVLDQQAKQQKKMAAGKSNKVTDSPMLNDIYSSPKHLSIREQSGGDDAASER